jgi:hypothetical protein
LAEANSAHWTIFAPSAKGISHLSFCFASLRVSKIWLILRIAIGPQLSRPYCLSLAGHTRIGRIVALVCFLSETNGILVRRLMSDNLGGYRTDGLDRPAAKLRRGHVALAGKSRRRLVWWKKLGFSLVATVGFFLILEAVLAVAGMRPVLYDEDPYVGFSSTVPLFVERTGEDGIRVMATTENRLHLFNPQQFPVRKSPGACRIFCLGGSTTYGHPYVDSTSFGGWLGEFLPTGRAGGK